jgi:hypothetical protein
MSAERYTAAQIIEALKATKGMVYLAADKLGCSHQTVYNYIERYPTVKTEWDSQNGKMGDTAELKLYQAIINGEPWAVAFYLKTKGKTRGYVERSEVTGADGNAIPVAFVDYRQGLKSSDDSTDA